MTPREKIYAAIDSERDYQDRLWGGHNHDKFHEPESWITYIDHYLAKAKEALCTTHIHDAYPVAMDNLRKVAALAVACMENHGVNPRYMEPGIPVKACPKCGGKAFDPVMRPKGKWAQVCKECRSEWEVTT